MKFFAYESYILRGTDNATEIIVHINYRIVYKITAMEKVLYPAMAAKQNAKALF